MSKLAIIAADAVEVGPLVRGWQYSQTSAQRHSIEIFEQGDVVVGFAGMGPIPGRVAADTVYKHCAGNIGEFLSVGFAGALSPALTVGDLVEPKRIVCTADDTEIINSSGEGTLVSAGAAAGVADKKMFAQNHKADAVDMEAYSVADVARIYGVPFRAIKVISDGLDFPMPPMGRFIDDYGRFHKASFAFYSAMRPWIWPDVWQLARNSSRATAVLCDRLRREIENFVAHKRNEKESSQPTEVSR